MRDVDKRIIFVFIENLGFAWALFIIFTGINGWKFLTCFFGSQAVGLHVL